MILGFTPQLTSAGSDRAPFHIETWAGYNYGGVNEGHNSPVSTIRRWVTYLEAPDAAAVYRICNVPGHPCSSVVYVDDSVQFFGRCGYSDPVINGRLKQEDTLPENAWLHKTQNRTYSNRIFYAYNPTKCAAGTQDTAMLVNHKSRQALEWMNSYYQREFGASIPDYYMNDDISVVNTFSGSAADEYRGWVDLQNAQAAWLGGQLNGRGQVQNVFFNGCDRNPFVEPAIGLIKMRPNIMGCENENGVNAADIRNGRDMYMLDNCARVSLNPNGGIFINGPDEEGSAEHPSILARRQATAFNWLCYVPKRVVFWEEEEWGSQNVNVFPEEGIYTAQPEQSMRTPSSCPDATISADGAGNDATSSAPCAVHGHNDLVIAGSTKVLRREFARCYNHSISIGRCAVIWNMGDAQVTVRADWLKRAYAHTMTLEPGPDGHGTIDDGGTATLTTSITPIGTTIPAYDALFLIQ